MAYVRNIPPIVDETPQCNMTDPRAPSRQNIEMSWDDENKFHELLSNFTALNVIIQANRKNDPAYCEELMRHVVKYPSVFDDIFTSRADLVRFAQKVSHPLAKIALEFIIEHPEEIQRIVKTERDVEVLNNQFKDYCSFFVKPDKKEFIVEVRKIDLK